jgi:hypothetical protein
MEKLAGKYKRTYLNAEAFIYVPELEQVRKFVEAIGNYANGVNEGFDSLIEAKNYVCIVHLQRMLAEVAIKAYGLLEVNLDQTDSYINQFFTGSPKTIKKEGKNVNNATLKHIIAEHYPEVAEVYNKANDYVHFSSYYYHDFLQEDSEFDFSNIFTEDYLNSLFSKMCELNDSLIDILGRILQKYEFVFPFIPDPRMGYLPNVQFGYQLTFRVDPDTNEYYAEGKISLHAAMEYYQKCVHTFQRVKEHQKRKAEKYGEENTERVDVTCTKLLEELYNMRNLIQIMVEIAKKEGLEALKDYSVLWAKVNLIPDPTGISDVSINGIYPYDLSEPIITKENIEGLSEKAQPLIEEQIRKEAEASKKNQ